MQAKMTQNHTMVQFYASFQTSWNILGFTSSSSRSQKRQSLDYYILQRKRKKGDFINHFFLISLLLCLLLCTFFSSFFSFFFFWLFFPCVHSCHCCRGHSTVVKPLVKISLALQNCPCFFLLQITVLRRISTLPDQYLGTIPFYFVLQNDWRPQTVTVECCLLYSPV